MIEGRGYRADEENNKITLFFEVEDLAEDDEKNLKPAGITINLGDYPEGEFPSEADIKEGVRLYELGGYNTPFGIKKATPLTPQEFWDKGYR